MRPEVADFTPPGDDEDVLEGDDLTRRIARLRGVIVRFSPATIRGEYPKGAAHEQ